MSDDLQPLNWLLNSKCPDINYAETKPKSSSKKCLDYILRNARNVLEECRFYLRVNVNGHVNKCDLSVARFDVLSPSKLTTPSIRPPLSYATLILLSLNSAPGKTLTLSQIYKWIKTTFKYYENTSGAKAVQWKNSIRHNLSLNKCFVKVPRGEGERGKGGFWTLDKQCERKLVNGENFYRLRKRRKTKVSSICREEVISTDGQECLGVVDWSGTDGQNIQQPPTVHHEPQQPEPEAMVLDATSSVQSVVTSGDSVTHDSTCETIKLLAFTPSPELSSSPFQVELALEESAHAQFDPNDLSQGSSAEQEQTTVHFEELSSVEPLLETTIVPLESLDTEVADGQDPTPYYELLPVEWTFELYGDPKGACFDFPGLELDLETWIG